MGHRADRRRWTRGDAGYSLIEMLVALALLSLAMALLPGALRLVTRGWEAERALEQRAEARLAIDFVAGRLAAALAAGDGTAAGSGQVLAGGADWLSFRAPSEVGPAGAGVYRFSLGPASAGPAGAPRGLVLRAASAAAAEAAAPDEPPRRLLPDTAAVRFRYWGAQSIDADGADWHQTWTRADALPLLVEINVYDHTGPAATPRRIVVAPRLAGPR